MTMFNKSIKIDAWKKLSFIVCVFGFLKEFRPSEPFIFEFLKGPWRNLTAEEINQEAFPVNTFSYLSQLIVVFLITDLCRYKPLIILLGISGIIIWSMLLWTTTLMELQILEGIYGTYMATEIAYYTYMYAKVPKEYYQQVTGHARAAILIGRCLSSITGQLLVSFYLMNYRELNYITLAAQIGATLWSFTLPNVKTSIYFNQEISNTQTTKKHRFIQAFSLFWTHFKISYFNVHVVKWSLWWAMAMSIFTQIQNYTQPLWSVILENDDTGNFNGGVEAVSMLLSIFGTIIASSIKIPNWKIGKDVILSITSIIIGIILLLSSQTEYIIVCYICYVIFNILYQFMITIATFEVSKHIPEDTHGLVFGINTFIAIALQTILTIIVVNGNVGLGLNPRSQFFVYGIYFFVIATIYLLIGLFTWFKK